jgi:gamma-glutamylcyclotransferase (GGCT)/AIG2-like uncharacterized protein YtfP
MLYFAFGSNLDPDQMRDRCPGNHLIGEAVVRDHKLIFPRFSERWGGGVASLQLSHGNDVWGVLYELSDEDLHALDACEGFRVPADAHNQYEREQVWVDLVRPEDGSVPRRVRAWTYLARPANPSLPSRRYLDAVIKGARAHRLPDDYVAMLSRLPVLAEETEPQS